ncbi:MAG: hypothetical protein ACE5PT_10615, partial [Gemmatimonadales bacterium]
ETDSTRIAVYGRSLGSAVALYLATHRPVRAVVLDSPFSSSRDMTEKHYPFLPAGLLRLRLDNVARAGRLKAPLLDRGLGSQRHVRHRGSILPRPDARVSGREAQVAPRKEG